MLPALFAGTVRHRRIVLSAAIVLAVGVPASFPLTEPATFGRFALILYVGVPAIGAAVLGHLARPPAALIADPHTPAFRPVPHAGPVYFAIMLTFFSAVQILLAIGDGTRGDRFLELLAAGRWLASAALVAVSAFWVAMAWRGIGVQLRPSGLVNRLPFGTLLVPWEALSPAYPIARRPQARSLVLAYARPELVRRRGMPVSRRRVATPDVDPLFLGRVIGHYVAYPQHRSAIGTEAEYDRLLFDCSYDS